MANFPSADLALDFPYRSTTEVARLVGRTPALLVSAIACGRMPSPRRVGNRFLWTVEDVRNARAMLTRRRKPAPLTGGAA